MRASFAKLRSGGICSFVGYPLSFTRPSSIFVTTAPAFTMPFWHFCSLRAIAVIAFGMFGEARPDQGIGHDWG